MSENNQIINYVNQYISSKRKKSQKKLMIKSLQVEIKPVKFSYNNICSICLEEPKREKVITCCNHLFCRDCIGVWLCNNQYCPVCKLNLNNS